MDVGRGAIKPYGLSWQYFAGPARGRGITPGPSVQQFGGGTTPVRAPQQPWGPYNQQQGLPAHQADASYGGGPRLGLQLPGVPQYGEPGPRFQPPMGPYYSEPPPALPHPGGLGVREPGLWFQQSLGPGSRALEVKHQSGFYNGQAGMGPPMVGIPGPGPQPPGGPYSQGMSMGMQPGAPYNMGLEPSHQHAGSGPGLPPPPTGKPGNVEPGVGAQMPGLQQGRIYVSSQNKVQGYKAGGPGQGRPPAGRSRSRDRSPAGKSRRRDSSPAGRSRRRDSSPAGTSRKQDSSPAGSSHRRGRSPAGPSRKRDRSPPEPSRRRDRSPAGTSRGRDRSPAGTGRKSDTSGAAASDRDRSSKRTKLSLQRMRSLKVEPFPPQRTVKAIQEALQDMFGKFGEITSIQVNGKYKDRSAMVFYKFVKDRDSALKGAQGNTLFNMNISVTVWPYKTHQSHSPEIESGFFAEEGSGTLYITNLCKNVFRVDLLRSFISFGEIVYTEVQRLPGLYNYGVVQFKHEGSVKRAISEMNGTFLSRNMLKEKFGDSFSLNCIFVSSLRKTRLSEESLVQHFSQFGTLKKVIFDPSNSRALVFFADVSSAELAIHEIRAKPGRNFLMGDYANKEFMTSSFRFAKVRGQNRKVFILGLGEPSKFGPTFVAKENETKILVDDSEEKQQKDILTGAGEVTEEADMLAEASEEETDMLAEASEEMKVLDEVDEKQDEVSPLLDCSEKIEASSDSGEEAAEPPEVDEKSVPASAGVVKKKKINKHTYSIPVLDHRKASSRNASRIKE